MMSRLAWIVGALALVTVAIAIAVVPQLNVRLWSPDPKPGNVPDDAVPIPYIAKSRLWVKCWVAGTETRCRIFNGGGDLVQDDVFVTYEHGTSVAASDLAIEPELSGPDHVWLKNGQILLPQTNYPEHRRNVERIVQSRK